MLKLYSFLIGFLIFTGLGAFIWIAKSNSVSVPSISQMSNNNQIVVKSIKLISREEKLPPLGVPKDPNRDIGFATVLLQLENLKEEKATLLIKTIQIYNAADGKRQNFTQEPKEIHLNPLENSEVAFQLTNKTGFNETKLVKGKVIYQIDNQSYTIESEPVEVNH